MRRNLGQRHVARKSPSWRRWYVGIPAGFTLSSRYFRIFSTPSHLHTIGYGDFLTKTRLRSKEYERKLANLPKTSLYSSEPMGFKRKGVDNLSLKEDAIRPNRTKKYNEIPRILPILAIFLHASISYASTPSQRVECKVAELVSAPIGVWRSMSMSNFADHSVRLFLCSPLRVRAFL